MLRTLIPARKSEDKYLASMGRVGNRQYHAQSVAIIEERSRVLATEMTEMTARSGTPSILAICDGI